MKKFLITIISFALFTIMPANAMVTDDTQDGHVQNKINQIGFRILNSNKIPYRITFFYNNNAKTINAYSAFFDRSITIYKGIILIADDEDEIASVLAHEISHSVDGYQGILRGYFQEVKYLLSPKKYEYKADKRAVDYLVNAGYNPLAIIVMDTKMMSQYRYDVFGTHPLSSRRVMEVYEYIYGKYPSFLAHNKYADNIYYQNFLLTSEKNRKKLEEKIKTNSKKRLKYD